MVAKYANSLRNHHREMEGREGGKVMYRTKREREEQWRKEGGKPNKSNWFRSAGYTSVLYVPATKGSELASRVAKVLETLPSPAGLKPRVQEVPGRSAIASLTKSNPVPRPTCGRRHCPWRARGEDCYEKCYQDSICYFAVCKACAEEREGAGQEQKDKVYLGESSRSSTYRSRRHFEDYLQAAAKMGRRTRPSASQGQQDTSSWMADHFRDQHGGNLPGDPMTAFYFYQLASYRKPLSRQVAEANHIQMASKTGMIIDGKVVLRVDREVMNRKDEMFSFNPRGRQWGMEERGRTRGL